MNWAFKGIGLANAATQEQVGTNRENQQILTANSIEQNNVVEILKAQVAALTAVSEPPPSPAQAQENATTTTTTTTTMCQWVQDTENHRPKATATPIQWVANKEACT